MTAQAQVAKKFRKQRVLILPITNDRRIILAVREVRGKGDVSVLLSTMCASANSGLETPEHAARRRLSEVGYTGGEVVSLGRHVMRRPHGRSSLVPVFLIHDCREKQRTGRASTEKEIEPRVVWLDTWLNEIMGEGDVLEPASMTATLKALLHIGARIRT